jgi:hypothetical protein
VCGLDARRRSGVTLRTEDTEVAPPPPPRSGTRGDDRVDGGVITGASTGGAGGVGSGGGSTFGGAVSVGGGGGEGGGGGVGTAMGGGGTGTDGTVTVGRLTVGVGGTALTPVPAQAPSSPSRKTTGTAPRGIFFITAMETRSFRRRETAHDFYDVLGVARDADADEIKRAFRALSRTLHPDVSPDPEAHRRFGEVSEAHAVLSRPESRRLYDRFGWRGRGRGFERRRTRAYASNPRGFLQDLESLFAAAAGQRPEQKPAEVVGSVELDPYEAHVGARRTVEVSANRPCTACAGTGHHRVISNRESGRFLSFDNCADCGGTGVAGETRALNIPVPPRVRDLDRVPVGPQQVAIVRIVPPRERAAVQTAAFAGLLVALGFFLFLLAL